jgi:hypothetical protein
VYDTRRFFDTGAASSSFAVAFTAFDGDLLETFSAAAFFDDFLLAFADLAGAVADAA